MRLIAIIAAAAMAGWALPVAAQDRVPCGKDLVCANAPDTILQSMLAAHYAAKLVKDENGDPMVEVTGEPYEFNVYFYGCEQHRNCDSLRFEVGFAKDEKAGIALANKWNAGHRFLTAAVKDSGGFVLSYDIGMIGGTTRRNFADTLDWWKSMLGEAADFFVKELKQ